MVSESRCRRKYSTNFLGMYFKASSDQTIARIASLHRKIKQPWNIVIRQQLCELVRSAFSFPSLSAEPERGYHGGGVFLSGTGDN